MFAIDVNSIVDKKIANSVSASSADEAEMFNVGGKNPYDKTTTETKKQTVYPDDVTLTESGEVRPVFYLRNQDGTLNKEYYTFAPPIPETQLYNMIASYSGAGTKALEIVGKVKELTKGKEKPAIGKKGGSIDLSKFDKTK